MKNSKIIQKAKVDYWLLVAVASLLLLGLTMVTSASIGIAEKSLGKPFYYSFHQAVYALFGIIGAFIVYSIPIKIWFRFAVPILIACILSLIVVLIPGVGKEVNGSIRWINLGFVSIQFSEFVKLGIIVYFSSYIVRYQADLRHKVSTFIRPLILIGFICGLLILEPDFGTSVVILATVFSLLFLAGVPLWQFFILMLIVGTMLGLIAVAAPYRIERLTSFLDPWSNQFDSGYQLTQALIAFGRGEWFGIGLGGSIQKLFYLPEAHTDFVFAVLAEELGLVGAVGTLSLYVLLVYRGMIVGLQAEKREDRFAAFICYGISLWVGLQTLINVGVNTGMLPTKGLTLPFISYGGNSLFVMCVAMGFLFRTDFENRVTHKGYSFLANMNGKRVQA
ncbi:putative lipid II flippase FtsW [Candidatus Berkiella cookevillensis]|uniref:Probable peptidoglycan glycosyltransferase FtsW n=1 Tax=Candidatus Berkiella cookevillensis TaxID=437022 RepID=A0A0Q9YFC9_9GAMM|nr:putative lipid II flippase FtsW [Candidatus Berkiella cookevillensis]MCS5708138.1 putative lipid II flippase FtsW [Candidatus Berkiella cookevillensis]